jgi:hypothetical protein
MPEVEPVMSADFPFSMAIPNEEHPGQGRAAGDSDG